MEQNITTTVFYLLAFVILASAFGVVRSTDVFHNALYLVLCFLGVAGLFLLLRADFLAAVQVLIYAGAVTILVIFAIMLTRRPDMSKSNLPNQRQGPAFVLAGLLFITMVLAFTSTDWSLSVQAVPEQTTRLIGQLLLNEYVWPFEIVSVVLLVALIGALILARED